MKLTTRQALTLSVFPLLAVATACGSTTTNSSGTSATTSPSASDGMSASAGSGYSARVILSGKSHGWSAPDDLASLGSNIFVGFQNGVPSTGPAKSGPQSSTLVEITRAGTVEKTWSLKGKIDGMGADQAKNRVIVTVNEDANSSLYTVASSGTVKHYAYAAPLPHKGGTDSVSVFNCQIYTSASNPTGKAVPALYKVTLSGSSAVASPAGIMDNSTASAVKGGAQAHLALTDPDSTTVVPSGAGKFANDFMLDAQGDDEAIFASSLPAMGSGLKVLKLSQSIDDTAFATAGGSMVVTDAKTDSVDLISGPFTAGDAYSVVTPGNANNAPATAPANYLAQLDLTTGTLTPITITGSKVTPHGMIALP
ncbi:MAG: hypothetical protein ACTHJM_00290 [Marmoricola sp.]